MIVKNSEKKENNKFEIIVEADAAEFSSAVNAAYNKNKKDIAIPGFRKGKTPRKVIEGMYGPEVFFQDAIDELAPAAFEYAITETAVKFVGAPSFVNYDITAEQTAVFTFAVELYPEATLGQYKGIEAVKEAVSVSDEAVAAELEAARKRNSRKINIEDRAAQMGDTVKIDFDGYLNGERFDGGKAENYSLELGSNSFVPGFEEQVAGMSLGEEKDLDITFPEQYVEELAGKAVVFKVKVNEITATELPELDDEFAKDNGFDTLDEYKADITANLTKKAEDAAETAFKNAVIEKAVENMTVEIPEVMVNEKIEEIVRNYAANFGMTDRNVEFAKLCEMMGLTPEIVNSSIRPNALMQVKSEILFDEVAKAEAFEITAEETEEYIKKVAESVGAEPEQVKAYFGEAYILSEQRKEKATDLIFSTAVATEKAAE